MGWLGLSDYFEEASRQCIGEGKPDEISFENWDNPGENHRYNSDNKYQNCAVMREEGEWTSELCDLFDGDSDQGEEWKERGRREKRTDFGVGVVAVLVALQY